MKHASVATAVLTAVIVAVVILPATIAWSASTWVEIRAPFTGYWDEWGYSPPCCHLNPSTPASGGDWATDYYQMPYTTGYWYAYSSSSANPFVTAQVVLRGNTCPLQASSWTYAGLKYRIEVTNDSGDLGWFEYDHVDPDGGYYFILQGSYVTNGMKIGRTYLWNGGVKLPGCWEVINDDGVHWHIVGLNHGTTYSCYPPHPTAALLSKQTNLIGVVGSNATGRGASCW
jgi:hypothetical protein